MSARQQWSERKATIYDDEGRSTVPKRVRDELGLEPGDEVKFVNADGVIIFKKKEQE